MNLYLFLFPLSLIACTGVIFIVVSIIIHLVREKGVNQAVSWRELLDERYKMSQEDICEVLAEKYEYYMNVDWQNNSQIKWAFTFPVSLLVFVSFSSI